MKKLDKVLKLHEMWLKLNSVERANLKLLLKNVDVAILKGGTLL